MFRRNGSSSGPWGRQSDLVRRNAQLLDSKSEHRLCEDLQRMVCFWFPIKSWNLSQFRSSEKNVLFSLFAVPCEAWKNPQSTSLSPKQYDVIAILRGKLKDYCKGNYKKWLLEKNKEVKKKSHSMERIEIVIFQGFTPGMELLKNYCQLRQNKLDGPTQTQFVNTINELIGWCIAWDPTLLTAVHERETFHKYNIFRTHHYFQTTTDRTHCFTPRSMLTSKRAQMNFVCSNRSSKLRSTEIDWKSCFLSLVCMGCHSWFTRWLRTGRRRWNWRWTNQLELDAHQVEWFLSSSKNDNLENSKHRNFVK